MALSCSCCGRFPLARLITSKFMSMSEGAFRELIAKNIPVAKPAAASAPATLFINGTILTMDADQSTAEVLLIQGQKITYVGPQSGLPDPLPDGTKTIDLGTNCLMPGFVDAHMHLVAAGLNAFMVDLTPQGLAAQNLSYTIDNVTSVLEQAAKQASIIFPWLLGAGFDASQLEVWENLTIAKLDAISTDIPIIIQAGSGHLSYVNSKTLALAKITNDTPDPPGGYLGRYGAGNSDNMPVGSLSGIFVELPAQSLIEAALENPLHPFVPDPVKFAAAVSAVMQNAARVGNTLINEAALGISLGYEKEKAFVDVVIDGYGQPVRMSSAMYLDEWDPSSFPAAFSDGPDFSNPMFVVQAVKLFADGSNQGITGYLTQKYSQWALANAQADYVGEHVCGNADATSPALATLMGQAITNGWQIMIHANGDAAIDNALAAYQTAGALDNTSLRHRIEHCSLSRDDQLQTMADLALSPSFLIAHVTNWGTVLTNILGPERVLLLDRCQSALDHSMTISLHTDHPVTPLGPLQMVQDAVTRIPQGSSQPLNEAECLTMQQALEAVTIGAAWQCHMDQYVGSLEPGKFADLVVLGQSPLTATGPISQIPVIQTWVNGAVAYPAP